MLSDKVLAPLLALRGTAADLPELHREKIGEALHALADRQIVEAGAHGLIMLGGGRNVPPDARTIIQSELAMGHALRSVANEFVARLPESNPAAQRGEIFASLATNTRNG